MRCSWTACGASFEGEALPEGWRWVCRHTSTGEHVCVCPEHVSEAADADLRALVRLSQGTPSGEVPSLDDGEAPVEETRRLLKGSVTPK